MEVYSKSRTRTACAAVGMFVFYFYFGILQEPILQNIFCHSWHFPKIRLIFSSWIKPLGKVHYNGSSRPLFRLFAPFSKITFLHQKCAKISSLRPGSIFELSTSRFASHDSPVTTRSRPNIYTSLHDSWFVTAGKKGLQYWSQERITRGKFGEERFQNILSMVLFLCVVNFVFAKFVHRVSLLLTIYWSHYNPPLEI